MLSKKHIGIVATLVLAVLLSQGRMLEFFLHHFLGRAMLLALLGFIAYSHKGIGLVAVLCVVLAVNQSNQYVHSYSPNQPSWSSVEGFQAKSKPEDPSKPEDASKPEDPSKPKDKPHTPEDTLVVASSSSSISNAETFKGREGFCMTDRESTIQRGKQSNVVPVSKSESSSVSPSDANAFSGEFATV